MRLEKINQEIDDLTKAVSQRTADIEEAKASVDRYNKQLNDVKNNREYDTLTKEIEFQTLEIELCQKKINEAQQRIKDREEALEQTKPASSEDVYVVFGSLSLMQLFIS